MHLFYCKINSVLCPLKNNNSENCNSHACQLPDFKRLLFHTEEPEQLDQICHDELRNDNEHNGLGRPQHLHCLNNGIGNKRTDCTAEQHIFGLYFEQRSERRAVREKPGPQTDEQRRELHKRIRYPYGRRFRDMYGGPREKRPGVVALVSGQGDGAGLEEQVHALRHLREEQGIFGAILLVDCGLSEEGRKLAELLSRGDRWVAVCRPEEVGGYLST